MVLDRSEVWKILGGAVDPGVRRASLGRSRETTGAVYCLKRQQRKSWPTPNGFLNFIPPPPAGVPKGAMKLGIAMAESGDLLQFIKGTVVLCGLLLLCNRFVPLALVVLAPIVLNILALTSSSRRTERGCRS
jgi:hypothetical protein